jgi:hypothetical protein
MDRPVDSGGYPRRAPAYRRALPWALMSPTWIWMQVAIVVFVLAGMIVAVTKLV